MFFFPCASFPFSRWILSKIVETNGLEWPPGRSSSAPSACSLQNLGDFAKKHQMEDILQVHHFPYFLKKHHQINVECHLDSRFDSVHVIYILGPHIELLRMKFTHRRAIWLEHQSHKFMFRSMNWTLFLVIFWLSTVTLQFLSITSTHMACLGAGQTEWMGVSFEKPKGKINKVLDTHWSIHSDRWMRSHCGHMH